MLWKSVVVKCEVCWLTLKFMFKKKYSYDINTAIFVMGWTKKAKISKSWSNIRRVVNSCFLCDFILLKFHRFSWYVWKLIVDKFEKHTCALLEDSAGVRVNIHLAHRLYFWISEWCIMWAFHWIMWALIRLMFHSTSWFQVCIQNIALHKVFVTTL